MKNAQSKLRRAHWAQDVLKEQDAAVKVRRCSRLLVAALVMTMAASMPACVEQPETDSASESMREAGDSAANAASSTGQVFVHAYQSAATAATDSTITARVKAALFNGQLTAAAPIHVTTVAGVVTLDGAVQSTEVAEGAAQLAQATVGVASVRNELTVVPDGRATN
jgi:osmotically-inducible protein OsmY